MIRFAILVAVASAALSGCDRGSVYERPIPDSDDRSALLEIRDGLKDEDQKAWQAIMMRKINPMAEPVRSKTVGEAVGKMKARQSCWDIHDFSKVPEVTLSPNEPGYEEAQHAYVARYNEEIDAHNACSKLPI